MKILLAIDSAEPSQNAVEEVLAHPWAPHSTVDVITVIEPAHLWTTSETADIVFRRAAELLRTTLERLRVAGLDANGDILQGDPKTAILDRADQTQPTLIVLGAHRVSAVEHFLLGNVGANVLRHASCSVLIARSGARSGGLKVLLPTDGSPSSELAARSVASQPWPPSTEFRVLSVVELILPPAQALFEPPLVRSPRIETLREEAMQKAQDAVAATRSILEPALPNISESISVLLDRPRDLIVKEAKEWGASLIVMGSHGRKGAQRFLLGSVSEGVAIHAACSVEVVR